MANQGNNSNNTTNQNSNGSSNNVMNKFESVVNKLSALLDSYSVRKQDGSIMSDAEIAQKAHDEMDAWIKLQKAKAEEITNTTEAYKEAMKSVIEAEKKRSEALIDAKYKDAGQLGKWAAQIEKRNATTNATADAINTIANTVQAAVNVLAAGGDVYVALIEYHIKSSKNAFEKARKEFSASYSLSASQIATFNTAISSSLTQTATEAQRAISKSVRDESIQRLKTRAEESIALQEYEYAQQEANFEKWNNVANAAIAAGAAITVLTGGTGTLIGSVVAGLGGLAKVGLKLYQSFKKLDIETKKFTKEIFEENIKRIQQGQELIKGQIDTIDTIVSSITEIARANETAFKKTGATLGYIGDSYASYMRGVAEETAAIFAITGEQMISMQKSYIESSNRNVLLSDSDFNSIEAISRVFGIDNSEVASMLGEMNIFNTSISTGYDIMNDMWHVATKIGVSTSKFSKDLTENLKLAQKYNFKGGVDNMAKLTMWAEKTRFNLQNTASFADKLMSNNISDILETSAKLQVLGGAATMYSDPLAMMWEAGNDVGALAKRQYAMFSDITGSFNRKTGETTFTQSDVRMIKAIADAMGMNYEDVLKQKRQSNKQGVINKALSKYNLDDDLLTAISNRATYKNGKFIVNTTNGEKDINELAALGNEATSLLLPEDTDDAIMSIARDVRSMAQKEDATKLTRQTKESNKQYDTLQDASTSAIQDTEKLYNSPLITNAITQNISNSTKIASEKITQTLDFLKNNQKNIDNYYEGLLKDAGEEIEVSKEIQTTLELYAKYGNTKALSEIISSVSNTIGAASKINNGRVSGEYQDSYDSIAKEYGNDSIEAKYAKDKFNSDLASRGVDKKVNDGFGYTNGGYISGASVTPINDGTGTLVKTHVKDQFLAAKSGGPIDKLFDIVSSIINENKKVGSSNSNSVKIDVSGNLSLSENGSSINLIEIMKKDPVASREFIKILTKAIDSSTNGKVSKAYYV